MKTPFLFTLLLIVASSMAAQVSAQTCLTTIDSARYQYELANPHDFPLHSVAQNKRVFHVRVHLFADEYGAFGISDTELSNCFVRLNNDFAGSGISFEISKTDSIEYCQYSQFTFPDELNELKVLYYKAGLINLFLVDEITTSADGLVKEGYTEYPGGDDLIIIPKQFMIDFGLSHQMGHFFGLYHTWETMFGAELPDSSNCTIAGDILCDTPADTLAPITADCNSTLPISPSGEGFSPPISNHMSNWPPCRCLFTIQQYNKIAWESRVTRKYLW